MWRRMAYSTRWVGRDQPRRKRTKPVTIRFCRRGLRLHTPFSVMRQIVGRGFVLTLPWPRGELRVFVGGSR
jgi:hypothetical protein